MAPRALIVIVRLTGASKWFLIDRINHFLNILQTSSIRANYKSVNLSWTDALSHQPFIVVSLTTFVTNFASNYKLDSEKIFFYVEVTRRKKMKSLECHFFLFQQLSFQCDQTCQKLTTVGKKNNAENKSKNWIGLIGPVLKFLLLKNWLENNGAWSDVDSVIYLGW